MEPDALWLSHEAPYSKRDRPAVGMIAAAMTAPVASMMLFLVGASINNPLESGVNPGTLVLGLLFFFAFAAVFGFIGAGLPLGVCFYLVELYLRRSHKARMLHYYLLAGAAAGALHVLLGVVLHPLTDNVALMLVLGLLLVEGILSGHGTPSFHLAIPVVAGVVSGWVYWMIAGRSLKAASAA